MSTLERVADAEVIDFDRAKAQHALDRFDNAVTNWAMSSVEMMDTMLEVREAKPWNIDDDFRAALAGGHIAASDNGSYMAEWVGFRSRLNARSEIGRTYAFDLAASGEVRRLLSSAIADEMLPSTEWATRPLQKLLRPRPLKSEKVDADELRDAAIAVYRDALEHEGDPAKAAKQIVTYIKRSDYPPLRRSVSKSAKQKDEERAAKVARLAKRMIEDGTELIKLKAFKSLDEVLVDLRENYDRAVRQ